jgi:ferredoxin-NADP reductase
MTAVTAVRTAAATEETFRVEVAEKTALSPGIVSLTLRQSANEDMPAWEPGAHIDLVLPNGLVRQYSLCGSVEDWRSWRLGVLREPVSRGGSTYIHDTLRVGDPLEVRGPRNHFALLPSPRYVFVAGGIGVTPLIPMAEQAERQGAAWVMIYCGRSREAMGYLDELQRRFGAHLIVNADDESGLFDVAGYFGTPRDDTLVYACGPTPLLDAISSATNAWPSGSVRFERFTPIKSDDSANVAFDVELARSGRTFTVPPDRSILEVLRGASVRVLSSCTEGTCGTCEVAVLRGTIDHRDSVLTPEEQETNEMMMVCVSRSRGERLVLDL